MTPHGSVTENYALRKKRSGATRRGGRARRMFGRGASKRRNGAWDIPRGPGPAPRARERAWPVSPLRSLVFAKPLSKLMFRNSTKQGDPPENQHLEDLGREKLSGNNNNK